MGGDPRVHTKGWGRWGVEEWSNLGVGVPWTKDGCGRLDLSLVSRQGSRVEFQTSRRRRWVWACASPDFLRDSSPDSPRTRRPECVGRRGPASVVPEVAKGYPGLSGLQRRRGRPVRLRVRGPRAVVRAADSAPSAVSLSVATDPCPGSPNRLDLGRDRHAAATRYRGRRGPLAAEPGGWDPQPVPSWSDFFAGRIEVPTWRTRDSLEGLRSPDGSATTLAQRNLQQGGP